MIVPTRGPEPFFFPRLGSRPPKTMTLTRDGDYSTFDDAQQRQLLETLAARMNVDRNAIAAVAWPRPG